MKNLFFFMCFFVFAFFLYSCNPTSLNMYDDPHTNPDWLVSQSYDITLYGELVMVSEIKVPWEVKFLSIETDSVNHIYIKGTSDVWNSGRVFQIPVHILADQTTTDSAEVSVVVTGGSSEMTITLPAPSLVKSKFGFSEIRIGEAGKTECYIWGHSK